MLSMANRHSFLPEVLRTGIDEIDGQHADLFLQVNVIEQHCIDQNGLRREDADALLESLRRHFDTEEQFAEGMGLDFSAHRTRHEQMYRTVALALDRGVLRLESVFGVVRYLQYWFERHIAHDDQPLSNALSASRDHPRPH